MAKEEIAFEKNKNRKKSLKVLQSMDKTNLQKIRLEKNLRYSSLQSQFLDLKNIDINFYKSTCTLPSAHH